ncbi:hypothetical protein V5739_05120 [Salinimicrobium sp. TIG7-5_MAKvit]
MQESQLSFFEHKTSEDQVSKMAFSEYLFEVFPEIDCSEHHLDFY